MTAPVIPSNPQELEEFLNDGTKMKSLLGNPKEMAELINAYSQKVLNTDKDLVHQFKRELEMGLVDFIEKAGVEARKDFKPGKAVEAIRKGGLRGRANKGQLHNATALGAPLDKEFATSVEFFQAMWHRADTLPNHKELAAKRARHAEIVNAYGSNVPSDGGFLIPEVLRSEIMSLVLEESIVRPLATVIPMESLKVPIPAVDETSRATNIFGGMQFYWTPESGAGTNSSAKFSQITLDAKKLFGYSGIPNELMRDAPAFLGWFGNKFPSGIAWFEDIAFLGGDGTDKPLGVINGAGTVQVTRAGTSSTTLSYADVVTMYSRMYPSSVKNAVWIASHDIFPALAELTFTPAGGTPVPVMLWQANAVGQPQAVLLGRPIIFTEKVGPFGTTGDLQFVDFTEYLIGDRQMMQLESSVDYLFGLDQTAFRILERVDGRPWVQSAITPHNGSTSTLSPYVALSSAHS
jgi:HK97 family phage major capsid protein